MSSGINRLHGRTFLQKDLCYEVFHRGYENSVFNTTYNFNGGNICGGGFWGGFAGGMGMGLGAGLMGMLGNWMGGFGNMFGGFGNMFGGFPMFGNFGCFGGGFPMMNWWGGGAGGSNASTTTVTGGSTTHNHYSNTTVKEKENKDLKKLDDLENKINKLEEKLKNNKKVSQKDFNKIYVKTFGYTLRDDEDTDVDNKRLEAFKARLNSFAEEYGYNKPEVKAEGEKAQVQAVPQTPVQEAEEVVEPRKQNNNAEVEPEKSLDEKINDLEDGNINGLFRLLGEQDYNDLLGDAKVAFDKKFKTGLNIIKMNPDKLNEVKAKIAGKEDLEKIYNEVIGQTEVVPEQTAIPDDLKADFEGYGLSDEEISTLLDCLQWDTKDGKKCLVPTTKISNEALVILNNHKGIKVAFANNPKAEDDTWIIGSVEIEKDDEENGEVKSYTINCKDVGKYGLKFKVTNMKNNLYNIKCTSTENESSYEKVYAADGGRTYRLEKDGVLHHSDSRGTVITKHKKNGYKEIPAKKLR